MAQYREDCQTLWCLQLSESGLWQPGLSLTNYGHSQIWSMMSPRWPQTFIYLSCHLAKAVWCEWAVIRVRSCWLVAFFFLLTGWQAPDSMIAMDLHCCMVDVIDNLFYFLFKDLSKTVCVKNVTFGSQLWCLEIKRTPLLANPGGLAHNWLTALSGLWVSLGKLENNNREGALT